MTDAGEGDRQDLKWLEARYAVLWDVWHDTSEAATAYLEQLEKSEGHTSKMIERMSALMELEVSSQKALIVAKRAVDDAYAAQEALLEPPPEPERTPEEQEQWVAFLTAEMLDAFGRRSKLKAEYDELMPASDLSQRLEGLEGDEETAALDAELEAIGKRVPVILALEQAENDLKAALAALERAAPTTDDE